MFANIREYSRIEIDSLPGFSYTRRVASDELADRLQEGEGLFQEFKTSLEKIDRSLVAFANAKGGVVYLGVDDQAKIHPFALTNKSRAQIQSIVRNIDPPLEIALRDLGKAHALIVKEGEEKPYRCADGFFMRIGATNQKLGRDEILDLAVRVNRIQFEALQVLSFKYPRDFSKASLDDFLQQSGLKGMDSAMGRENFLISLGAVHKQRGRLLFNHAGVLFFAKNPQSFLPQAKISYARYQGTTKTQVVDRAFFTGSLARQLHDSYQRLLQHIPVRYRLIDQETRKEIPHYPPRALEEAVINALIHRDYFQNGAEVMIDHYQDRIEISNPGELLGSLTIEKLGERSMRRNPLIAELFYRMGKGEKLGSGIVRMKALMEEWKLPPPLFRSSEGFFVAAFFGPKGEVADEKLILLPERPRHFMEYRNRVEEPFFTSTYADFFSVNRRTAQKDLGVLVRKRLIVRQGKGKNTSYRFRSR